MFLRGAGSISGPENLIGIMQLTSTSTLPGRGATWPFFPNTCYTFKMIHLPPKNNHMALIAYLSIRKNSSAGWKQEAGGEGRQNST